MVQLAPKSAPPTLGNLASKARGGFPRTEPCAGAQMGARPRRGLGSPSAGPGQRCSLASPVSLHSHKPAPNSHARLSPLSPGLVTSGKRGARV